MAAAALLEREARPNGLSALGTCRTGARLAVGADDTGSTSSGHACKPSSEALTCSVRLKAH
jgi:hypothetical protein